MKHLYKSWKALCNRLVAARKIARPFRAPATRGLRMESLECRQLLSISPAAALGASSGADIEILSFSGDGEDMIAYYSVHDADASPFDISVYRSRDGVTAFGKPLATVSAPELSEGDAYKAVIPSDFTYNDHAKFTLIAKVDATDAVFEADETNNSMAYEGGLLGSSMVDWSKAATVAVSDAGSSKTGDVSVMSLPASATVLNGSSGDDTYTVSINSSNNIVVNGTTYSAWVKIYAAGGSNTVSITGKAGEEVGEFTPRVSSYNSSSPFKTGEWLGPNSDYKIEIYDANTVYAYGQTTEDTVTINGTSGNDTVVSKPYADWTYLSGSGYFMRANAVETVVTTAGSGGTDTASMRDGTGDDIFYFNESGANEGHMVAGAYDVTCANFDTIDVIRQSGGADTANLYDSTADDSFYAYADRDANGTNIVSGSFSGNGQTVNLTQFRTMHAYGTRGGTDSSYLYDSSANDTFQNRPNDYSGLGQAKLFDSASSYYFRTKGFEQNLAYALNGGTDYASMTDKPGDDTAISEVYSTSVDWMKVQGTGHYARAKFFEDVDVVFSQGGYDKAYAYTTSGNTPTIGDDYLQVVTNRTHEVYNTPYIRVTNSGTSTGGSMDLGPVSDLTLSEDFGTYNVPVTGLSTGVLSATSDNASLANASGSGSNVQLTSQANQYGDTTIHVQAYDSAYHTTAYTNFDLAVTSVNDAPTLNTISSRTINEDAGVQSVGLSGITAGGGESQTLTVSATSSNTALIPNPSVSYVSPNSTGSLSLSPVANKWGTAVITVTVSDGSLQTQRTFNVTVNAVNDAPTLNAISTLGINEDATSRTVSLSGITAGGGESQTLAVTASSANTGLIPNPSVSYTSPSSSGSISFAPVANQFGSTTITVTARDAGLDGTLWNSDDGTISRTFTVTVSAVNDAPEASASSVQTDEDVIYTFQLGDIGYSDIDGDSMASIRVKDVPQHGVLKLNGVDVVYDTDVPASDIAAGNLKYHPDPDSDVDDTFRFFVYDGAAYSATSAYMTIDVVPVPDPPTSANSAVSMDEDGTYTFATSDFAFSGESGTTLSTIRVTSVQTTYTEAGNLQNGIAGIDGQTGTGYIMYSEENVRTRWASAPPYATGSDHFVSVTYRNGTWNYDTNTALVPFTPQPGDVLVADIDFNSTPDTVTSAQGLATTVEGIERGYQYGDLEIVPDRFVTEDTANVGEFWLGGTYFVRNTPRPATANGLELSGTAVTAGQVISVSEISAGNLQFTPSADDFGTPFTAFDFQVSDGSLYSVSDYQMTINVNGVNDPPEFPAGPFALTVLDDAANGTVVGGVAAVDRDPGTTLTYTIAEGDPDGAFAIDNNGTITVADTTKLDYFETQWYELRLAASDETTTTQVWVVVCVNTNRTRVGVFATDPYASEVGPDSGEFLIVREGKVDQDMTFYFTLGGTAVCGASTGYETVVTSVTMAVDQYFATVAINPYDDTFVDNGDETVVLTLQADPSYTVHSEYNEATVSIFDDETATVSVHTTIAQTTEGSAEAAQITVSRTGPTDAALPVNFTTAGEGASPAGSGDYSLASDGTAITNSVTIPAGEDSVVIDVSGTEETPGVFEGDESFQLTLSGGAGYRIDESAADAVVTIDDADDQTVGIFATQAEAVEEDLESGWFAIIRQGDIADYLSVNFSVSLTASTADAQDFGMTTNGTAVFLPNQDRFLVPVWPVDDGITEGDETVVVELASGADYWLLEAATDATVTILDGGYDRTTENWVSVQASTSVINETDSPTSATFTLSRTGPLDEERSVEYLLSGSATEGQDYTVSGSGTFAVGSATTTITVTAIDDSVWEDDQTIELVVYPALDDGYVVEPGQANAVVTIPANDDPNGEVVAAAMSATVPVVASAVEPLDSLVGPPVVVMESTTLYTTSFVNWSDTTINEDGETSCTVRIGVSPAVPADATESVCFQLSVLAPPAGFNQAESGDYSVQYASGDDTPQNAYLSGVFTINPGDSYGELTITAEDDVLFEGDEVFQLALSAATNTTPSIPTTNPSITIADDDGLTFTTNDGHEDNSTANFNLFLTQAQSQDVVIYYSLGGTATPGADYTAPTGNSVTIPQGTLGPATIPLPVLPDDFVEHDETVTLAATISTSGGGSSGEPLMYRSSLTIASDDEQFEVIGRTVPEHAEISYFTVKPVDGKSIDQDPNRTHHTFHFDWVTSDVEAIAGEDYQYSNGTLAVGYSLNYGYIPIYQNDDGIEDALVPDERFLVAVTPAMDEVSEIEDTTLWTPYMTIFEPGIDLDIDGADDQFEMQEGENVLVRNDGAPDSPEANELDLTLTATDSQKLEDWDFGPFNVTFQITAGDPFGYSASGLVELKGDINGTTIDIVDGTTMPRSVMPTSLTAKALTMIDMDVYVTVTLSGQYYEVSDTVLLNLDPLDLSFAGLASAEETSPGYLIAKNNDKDGGSGFRDSALPIVRLDNDVYTLSVNAPSSGEGAELQYSESTLRIYSMESGSPVLLPSGTIVMDTHTLYVDGRSPGKGEIKLVANGVEDLITTFVIEPQVVQLPQYLFAAATYATPVMFQIVGADEADQELQLEGIFASLWTPVYDAEHGILMEGMTRLGGWWTLYDGDTSAPTRFVEGDGTVRHDPVLGVSDGVGSIFTAYVPSSSYAGIDLAGPGDMTENAYFSIAVHVRFENGTQETEAASPLPVWHETKLGTNDSYDPVANPNGIHPVTLEQPVALTGARVPYFFDRDSLAYDIGKKVGFDDMEYQTPVVRMLDGRVPAEDSADAESERILLVKNGRGDQWDIGEDLTAAEATHAYGDLSSTQVLDNVLADTTLVNSSLAEWITESHVEEIDTNNQWGADDGRGRVVAAVATSPQLGVSFYASYGGQGLGAGVLESGEQAMDLSNHTGQLEMDLFESCELNLSASVGDGQSGGAVTNMTVTKTISGLGWAMAKNRQFSMLSGVANVLASAVDEVKSQATLSTANSVAWKQVVIYDPGDPDNAKPEEGLSEFVVCRPGETVQRTFGMSTSSLIDLEAGRRLAAYVVLGTEAAGTITEEVGPFTFFDNEGHAWAMFQEAVAGQFSTCTVKLKEK